MKKMKRLQPDLVHLCWLVKTLQDLRGREYMVETLNLIRDKRIVPSRSVPISHTLALSLSLSLSFYIYIYIYIGGMLRGSAGESN